MCCEADWKREVVQDYKWDYIDVRDFRKTDGVTRFKYLIAYIMVFKQIAIFGLDIFTCITMISTDHWTNAVYSQCNKGGHTDDTCTLVKFSIARWVFVGCIIFSILLYAYEIYKARQVIRSRDISYSFTNIMANDYYSIKDYNKFCLFCRLGQGKDGKDKIAFFVFFSFKDWKRVLLADGPRQCINAIILYSILRAFNFNFEWDSLSQYWSNSPMTACLLFAMISTVLLFLIGFISLCVAAILYIPLLCYIQGNLKEYICHKVDKRINDIMRRIQRDRIHRNNEIEKKIAVGGTITNSKGEAIDASLLQPTLPQIALDDEDYSIKRPMSPGVARAMSPINGMRPMSPINGGMRPMSPSNHPPPRSRSPGPNNFYQPPLPPQQQQPQPLPVTDEDIYDAYGGGSDDRHSYPMASYDDGFGASNTSLITHAAPPGLSYPPSAPPGAPVYPPSFAQPQQRTPLPPPRAAVQYEATRVAVWGYSAGGGGGGPAPHSQPYDPRNQSHGW